MKKESYSQNKAYRKIKKAEHLISEYNDFLDKDLGLAPTTRKHYCYFVHLFLKFKFGSKAIQINDISPKDVINCILSCFKKKARTVHSI